MLSFTPRQRILTPTQIFVLAISIFLLVPTHAARAENEFRVGVIVPLSGGGAQLGNALKNGIELAYAGLSAKEQARLKLYFEDDQMQSMNSISALNKLIANEKINMLISVTSGTSNALAPLAERAGMPHIAVASDGKISRDKKYVVNFLVTPEEEARVVQLEVKRRGYKRVARFTTTQDGCLAVRDRMDLDNSAKDVDYVIDEDLPLETKDFRSLATKIRNTPKLDAIGMLCLQSHCGVLARQIREAGVKLPLFGFHTIEDRNEIKQSGGALVGAWYVTSADPTPEFKKEYLAKYADDSLMYVAGHGYDSVLMIQEALKEGGDKDTVNKFLHTVQNFKGALGTYSASGDNRFLLPAMVKEITETGFKPVTP